MHDLIRKIHMYVGLLNFTVLLVFGIAGLTATFQAETVMQQKTPPEVRYQDFQAPPNLSDKEMMLRVYEAVKPPLSGPFAPIRRNENNQLTFDFFSQTGIRRVVVLENENRLRIERRRNSVWRYLNSLHATTHNTRSPDLRVRLWSWYIELSIWSLIAMAISGVYLWLSSRPGFRWAQFSFAAGCGIFIALYALTR